MVAGGLDRNSSLDCSGIRAARRGPTDKLTHSGRDNGENHETAKDTDAASRAQPVQKPHESTGELLAIPLFER